MQTPAAPTRFLERSMAEIYDMVIRDAVHRVLAKDLQLHKYKPAAGADRPEASELDALIRRMAAHSIRSINAYTRRIPDGILNAGRSGTNPRGREG